MVCINPRFAPLLILLVLACSSTADREAESAAPLPPSPSTLPEVTAPPACLELEMWEEGGVPIPARLQRLAGPQMIGGGEFLRGFESESHTRPTATGYQPTGHVFRWVVQERLGNRMHDSSSLYRARMGVESGNAPLGEGYESSQIRTLETRLPTQTAQEVVLTVVNSTAEERPTTVALRCVDHGRVRMTLADFARLGWLSPHLAPIVEALGASPVHLVSDHGKEVLVEGELSDFEPYISPQIQVGARNGLLRVVVN